jgi:hypothetical protein
MIFFSSPTNLVLSGTYSVVLPILRHLDRMDEQSLTFPTILKCVLVIMVLIEISCHGVLP